MVRYLCSRAGVTIVGVLLVLLPISSGLPASAQEISARSTFAPDGVLFFPSVAGLMPALGAPHYCSASVVDSPGHDIVVTAAHCLYGNGATIEFAPGFRNGKTPYGVWTVTSLYVEPAWQSGQSPEADVAFLRIAPLQGRQVQNVVGGRPLAFPSAGRRVVVSGFPMSSNTPSVCASVLVLTKGYPSVTCPGGGMTDGVSGGAWIQSGAVVGVVGGLQQGGCSPKVAYSTPFNATTRRLLARAETGRAGDFVLPGFFANSCP